MLSNVLSDYKPTSSVDLSVISTVVVVVNISANLHFP